MSRYGSISQFQGSSTGGHLNESGGGGGADNTIITQDEGVLVNAASTSLNFVGGGVTVTDAGGNVTTVTITGGGGGGGTIDPSIPDGVYYSTRVTVAGGDITALETDGSLNDPIFSKNNETFAMGTLLPGNGSVCLGNNSECGTAVGSNDVALGPNCIATESESQSVGSNNNNKGLRSGVFGLNNIIVPGAGEAYVFGDTNEVGADVTGALVLGSANRINFGAANSCTCVGRDNQFINSNDVHGFGSNQLIISRNNETTLGPGNSVTLFSDTFHCVPFVAKTPVSRSAQFSIANEFTVDIGDDVSGTIQIPGNVPSGVEQIVNVTCPRSCGASHWLISLTFTQPPAAGETIGSHHISMVPASQAVNGTATIWFKHTRASESLSCYISYVILNPVSGIAT